MLLSTAKWLVCAFFFMSFLIEAGTKTLSYKILDYPLLTGISEFIQVLQLRFKDFILHWEALFN